MVFAISVDPYEQDCIVVVNGTMKDAVSYLEKQDTENARLLISHIKEHTDWEACKNKRNGAIIYTELVCGYIMMFDHEENWIATVAHVIHEALHLTISVLGKAGLTLTPESEEAYTYLQTKICIEICRKIY